MRERLPLPPKIANAPALAMGLELYYAAFLDLMSCRGGMGDGMIPWSTVREYGLVNEFSEEQIEDLHYHVTRLDEAYLKHLATKRPGSGGAAGGGAIGQS